MAQKLNVLLVEDDEDDYILAAELLSTAFDDKVEITWEQDWAKARELLCDRTFDVCLLDHFLGERSGVELVMEATQCDVATPIILLTGNGNRDVDLAAMQAGAADYLDKRCLNPALLERSIRYAIKHTTTQSRRRAAGGNTLPRVLLIEDDEDDFILTQDMLMEVHGPDFDLDWVRTWEDAMTAFNAQEHDIYLLDYRLGAWNGLDLVEEATSRGCTAPIILLTGQGNREIDMEAMKAGAADFLIKSEISAPLLDRAIRYAIERHRGEQRLTELAQFDQLTGLANRSLFRDYLMRTITRADRNHQPVAILFLDLDRFKIINDTHGHDVGDQLLVSVAERLRDCVRSSDLVARLGGDEFTVVVEGISDPNILSHFCDRILRALKEPVRVCGLELSVNASIGLSIYPSDADNLEDLVKSADTAMYRAKEKGPGNYQFYTMAMHVAATRHREIEDGLRRALEREEFEVWYQPQMDLTTGRICGLEALLRWIHPHRGVVSPTNFIHLAEESGLIVPIGEWVFDQVCRKGLALADQNIDELKLAVNFSARQFQEKGLTKSIMSIIERSGVRADRLEVELTENSILKDPSRASAVLHHFAKLGMQIALDDFGTGYSSLKHLRSFPGGTIKIDRSFVNNIATNADDAAIVRAIIGMAHNMRLRVVAEGVETAAQLKFLEHLNCDAVQGYLFSKPVPSDQVTPDFLSKSWQPVPTIDAEVVPNLLTLKKAG